MKKHLWIAGIILSINFARSQTTSYFILDGGYENFNGNYGVLGAALFLVQNNDHVINFSFHAQMGYMKNQFRLVPEAEIGYTFSGKNKAPYKDVNASFYKISMAVNPYSVKPKLGICILNIWEIYAGYSFQFSPNAFKSYNGWVIGTQFHLPIQLFSK